MTLDTLGGRHNMPEVVLGDEREELETETASDSVSCLGFFFLRVSNTYVRNVVCY